MLAEWLNKQLSIKGYNKGVTNGSSEKRRKHAGWNNQSGLKGCKPRTGKDSWSGANYSCTSKSPETRTEGVFGAGSRGRLTKQGRVCVEAERGRWTVSGDERGQRLRSQNAELGSLEGRIEKHRRCLGSGGTWGNWWFRMIGLVLVVEWTGSWREWIWEILFGVSVGVKLRISWF